MASAPLALPVTLAVLAAAYLAWCAHTALRGWLLDCREARAAEASRTAPATAHGPAVLASLPLPVPALERDGEPLSAAEQSVLEQVRWDSDWITIQDARYGGHRG